MNSKIFIVIFLAGFTCFVVINIHSFSQVVDPMCSFPNEFGFPFTLGNYGGFVTTTNILWGGLVANLVVALCSSLILALAIVKIRQL
ncbi:MAG: hypothetical protein KIS76_06610 [Pyrinomonadaceae bacterium]|nr:hypothetical protein [Pyrinomonadaceae bacterium]